MRIRAEHADGVVVAAIEGDLDGRGAVAAQRELEGLMEPGGALLLDVSGMTYLSSGGLRLLYLLRGHAEEERCRLAVSGLTDEVRSVLSATGFLDFFVVHDTVAQATAALRGSGVTVDGGEV